jgi:hypothetical protein
MSSSIQPSFNPSGELSTRPRAFERFPWLIGLPLAFGRLATFLRSVNPVPNDLDNETGVFILVSRANEVLENMLTIVQRLARALDTYNPTSAFPDPTMRSNVTRYLESDAERLLSADWPGLNSGHIVEAVHVLMRFSLLDRLADAYSLEKLPDFRAVPRQTLHTPVSQKLREVCCHPSLCQPD